MILLSNLAEANRNLWRNKLRSILTIIAIMVGSFSIIVSLAIQTGAKTFIDDEFNAIGGDNVITILPNEITDLSSMGMTNEIVEYEEGKGDILSAGITKDQINKIKQIQGIKTDSVKPFTTLSVDYITSQNSDKKYRINVSNVSSESFNIELAYGKKLDLKAEENQIILPSGYAQKFGFNDDESIVGKDVELHVALPVAEMTNLLDQTEQLQEEGNTTDSDVNISNEETKSNTQEQNINESATDTANKFATIVARVVGIRKDAVIAFSSGDALVNDKLADLIKTENDKSLNAYQKDKVFSLQAEYEDGANVDHIMAELEKMKLIGSTKEDLIEGTHEFLDVLTIILYIFGGIALLVAAIGIINTLMMSVQERTKEIGLNKALGMSSARVFKIFSLESILLGFWGSALGTIIAIGVGKITDQILHREGMLLADFTDFHIVKFTVFNIAVVIAIVMFIAFLAGTLPAIRAAKKNPIDALRYE